MDNKKRIPERLYRYQDFDSRSLNMIVSDTIHFSDPATFNDPLDTKPSLDPDLDNIQMVETLKALIEHRVRAEMFGAARTMKVHESKAMDYIERSSRREAERVISDIEYNATNTEYDVNDYKHSLLRQEVERELLRRYDKGVVALTERSDCPLTRLRQLGPLGDGNALIFRDRTPKGRHYTARPGGPPTWRQDRSLGAGCLGNVRCS